MMKKALSVILAALMLISIVPLVSAETEYNYTVKTEFYGYDTATEEWIPVTTAAGGDTLKMRVSVSTNFVSGSSTLLLAYDKSVLSAGLPSNGSSTQLVTNPKKTSFAYNYIQRVNGAHGTGAANKQLGYGNLTQEQYDKYGFIVCMSVISGCVQYDGSDWLFEIDMNVLGGTIGKSIECFVIPETVQTKTNKEGVVSFPYAPEVSSDISTLTSALNWYEGTPVVEAEKVEVTADNTPPAIYTVQWVVDGETVLSEEYEAGASVNEPVAPSKTGYTFAGWTPEIPDSMPEENLTFTAQWQVNCYETGFNANGGEFSDGSDWAYAATDFGSQIIAPEIPVKEGYVFAGWSESEGGEVVENLGIIDSEEGKAFYAQWIAADDVAYTVETYTMLPDGTYNLSATAHTGTTGETVFATVSAGEGFGLNEEKSVTEGEIAPDGSLVLKVYYDRKIYKFTTVVNGVKTSTEYRYGATVTAPEAPAVQGYAFRGWDGEIPVAMPASDITLTARFAVAAIVSIKNNPGSKTINYGETLRLTAETANMPNGAYVKWYVEGSGVSMSQNAENSTCDITSTGNGTVTVTAKVVDKNGNPLTNDSGEISDSQKVVSKAGIWQKIVSFFKNLFRANRTIIQVFKVL